MKWIMYIVHVQERSGAFYHHIGLTRREDLRKRLKEHRRGKGSKEIRRRRLEGATCQIAKLDGDACLGLERLLKTASQHTLRMQICPICEATRAGDHNAKEATQQGRPLHFPP